MFWNYVAIFFVSLFGICLELFLTRVLNLKTFNHLVYVIIPFTLLGFGVGANIYFLTVQKLKKYESRFIIGWSLFFLAFITFLSVKILIYFPVSIEYLKNIFVRAEAGLLLSAAYLFVMAPYAVIGFLVLFLFSSNKELSYKLYCFDLIGAGAGAVLFYFMISGMQVLLSVVLLCVCSLALALCFFFPARKIIAALFLFISVLVTIVGVNEPENYRSSKPGWENFENHFHGYMYSRLFALWHPLGRTDAYHLNTPEYQEQLRLSNMGTFEINVEPEPDFYYLSTNYLAGTPVYKFSDRGLDERGSVVTLFSRGMEAPYIFFSEPRVVIIGAGGGRDIFMAKSHGAKEIKAAEINPMIHKVMSPGGPFYEYSGMVYGGENVEVFNGDGRNLVKRIEKDKYDLVILNGVDTYSGLSSGAYTYAESYLYTKEAVKDYLAVLNDDGIISFNRWFFDDSPRETLRLFVIVMDALTEMGFEKPWEHVVVGKHLTWGLTFVKKTPFEIQEQQALKMYFETHSTKEIFSSADLIGKDEEKLNMFEKYVVALKEGREGKFVKDYKYDISTVTDDNPFFYKYYRLRDFSPELYSVFDRVKGAGFVIFVTQALVLFHAFLFSIVFIGLPLLKLRRSGFEAVPGGKVIPFVVYYICLGLGFMFIEIPLMQQFVLLLGSPIYSLTVVLAALLIFTGVGSLLLKRLQHVLGSALTVITQATCVLAVLLIVFGVFKESIMASLISQPFSIRAIMVCLLTAPIGLCLGVFFPAGLHLIKKGEDDIMPWAWAINFGFSVVGSMAAIMAAQQMGFRFVLMAAVGIYFVAMVQFRKMADET